VWQAERLIQQHQPLMNRLPLMLQLPHDLPPLFLHAIVLDDLYAYVYRYLLLVQDPLQQLFP
jgi:hypothetical protein